MLTHTDPVIQSLLDDITEQRDRAMLDKANLKVALNAAQAQIAELTAPKPDTEPPQ
jgi:hypothetical protein